MKTILRRTFSAAVFGAVLLSIASCSGANSGSGETASAAAAAAATGEAADTEHGSTESAETATAESEGSDGPEEEAVTSAAQIDPKTADYSKIDIDIAYDSPDEIVQFTNDMLAGKYDGKVVRCDGETGRRMFGNAMMQKQADGSSRGFTWYIVDSTDENDYPPDGARAQITGVVGIGEYDVRYLYVLQENVVLAGEDGAADVTAESETSGDIAASESVFPFKNGVWWEQTGNVGTYWTFNGNIGSTMGQELGIGAPFSAEKNGDGVMLHVFSADDNTPVKFNVIDENNVEITFTDSDTSGKLTFLSDDIENFRFFTNEELAELAVHYYAGTHDGYMPANSVAELQEDGTVAIQLFDEVDGHNSTADWYYVDRFTAKGTNVLGEPVDLDMSAGGAGDMPTEGEVTAGTATTIIPDAWNPDVVHRQVMLDNDEFFGVRYLGFIEYYANNYDNFAPYIDNILETTGTFEDFDFMLSIPHDRFVSSDFGTELYLVIPFDEKGSVKVVPQAAPGEDGTDLVTALYESSDGEPFLLKCNVSEVYPDVKVIFTDSNGESTEWCPGLSGEDGHVLTVNSAVKKVHDFTNYDRLATALIAPVG